MKEHELGFDTLQVHAGQYPDKETGARAVPIYQTTSFVFKSIEHATDLFSLKAPGNIYTRIMNPTSTVLEKRIAVLEGGIGALAVASGSAAISMAILNIVGAGDEIVSANTLYGGTYNLFAHTLRKLNIRTHFVDPNTISNFEDAIGKRTKAIFIETIGNPSNNIIDIEKVAEIAHLYDLPLIVDNTFGTPYLIRPIDFGADIVVHSATKYICGHGTAIGGLIIDAGKFDWEKSDRFPMLTEQDVSYHGIQYTKKFKEKAYIAKARVQLLRDLGAAISPFNSFLLLQGLETLSLRVEKHVSNAKKVAKFLNGHPKVKWVNYPSLQSNKYHDLAQKYMPKGSGSIFSFGLDGSMDASKTFIENLQLFSLLANVADAKSLVIHPASTTHQQLTENERQVAGITTDMIRLSIGIEDADDLIEDLRQALEKGLEKLKS